MTDRELLELIARQVSTLTTQVDTLTTQVDTLTTQADTLTAQVNGLAKDMDEVKANMATKDELAEVKADVKFTKETVIKMEIDHGQKLNALFDGYKLNSEKLDRIEAEVSKHEEFIIKKLK